MVNVIDLFNLQKIDYNQSKLRQRLLQIQKALTESDSISAARTTMEKAETELQGWQAKVKEGELEIASLAERIDETDKSLMSGDVSNPKELEALQASLDSLKRQRETFEESSVEAMAKVEDLQATLDQKKAKLAATEAEWKNGQKELRTEGAKLQKQYIMLKEKRKSASGSIDAQLLDNYEQLRKRKGGIAVAQLDGDGCGVCHMQVPSGIVSAARSERDDLVHCPSCGRILYGD